MSNEIIFAIVVMVTMPVSFLAGWLFGHRDRARWYVARMEEHLRKWNEFCDRAMHESDGAK